MAVCLEYVMSTSEETKTKHDGQMAFGSRAALPTQPRPETLVVLTLNLQKETSYSSQGARRVDVTSPLRNSSAHGSRSSRTRTRS